MSGFFDYVEPKGLRMMNFVDFPSGYDVVYDFSPD